MSESGSDQRDCHSLEGGQKETEMRGRMAGGQSDMMSGVLPENLSPHNCTGIGSSWEAENVFQ